jgi:hypothetical protein
VHILLWFLVYFYCIVKTTVGDRWSLVAIKTLCDKIKCMHTQFSRMSDMTRGRENWFVCRTKYMNKPANEFVLKTQSSVKRPLGVCSASSSISIIIIIFDCLLLYKVETEKKSGGLCVCEPENHNNKKMFNVIVCTRDSLNHRLLYIYIWVYSMCTYIFLNINSLDGFALRTYTHYIDNPTTAPAVFVYFL